MTQVQRIYLLKMWFSIAALNSQRVIKVQPPSSSYQKGSQTCCSEEMPVVGYMQELALQPLISHKVLMGKVKFPYK